MVMNNMLSGYEGVYEAAALRKDGSTFPAEIQARMMQYKGRAVRATALSDISERKRAVEALQESEEKFRTLVTNTEQIVFMIAKDGTFLLSEGKGLSKLGLKPGDVVGKSVFELYEDYPDMLDAMRKVLNGETATIEVNIGGNHFSNWYTPHRDQEGEIIGLMGLSVNISERKRAEEVLEAELAYHREDLSVLVQRHSLAVKISSFGIWEWDVEENAMIWDNTLFEIYGIEKKIPLPYEEWLQLIHPDDLPTVEATMRTVIENKSETFFEFRIVRPDGELRHISAAGTAVLSDAGEVVKAIGINQDISERKRLETQEQETAVLEERDRLARELHDAVTQTLFSASMIAEATPALWDKDPAVGRQYLGQLPWMLRGALAEMRTLLMELRPTALRDQSLGQLLEPLADAIRVRSGGATVVLKVEGDCSLPEDVTLALYRIVQESLNNIARHAEADQISVWLRCDEADVKVYISDNGRGFDPGSIPAGHLGVGIMKDRARQVGATFRIDSEPGQGTMVIISWSDQPLSNQ
jgi:PAS domain S-box-containing protein